MYIVITDDFGTHKPKTDKNSGLLSKCITTSCLGVESSVFSKSVPCFSKNWGRIEREVLYGFVVCCRVLSRSRLIPQSPREPVTPLGARQDSEADCVKWMN